MAFIKLTIILLLTVRCAEAQTFAEWFDQRRTQKKYLQQQIAALQAYASVLKTGYNVAHNGLASIGGFNQRESGWHRRYYQELHTVSPAVSNDSRVRDILLWQQDILATFRHLKSDLYNDQVKAAVLKDCDQLLTDLQNTIADDQLEISDADRLRRVRAIHIAMLGNYQFTVSFCNRAALIQADRRKQSKELQTLQHLYGTN